MVRSRTYVATPPGATIREQLDDRKMTQKEFAARMGFSEKHVSHLINGEVRLTPDTAEKLEMVLGVPAKFWNNLEAVYREKIAKVNAENAMDQDAELARQLPYSEMVKYGWVPAAGTIQEKVVFLRKYFEVAELTYLENAQITRIACRRLAITNKGDFALMAWAQEVRIRAREISTEPIDLQRLQVYLPDIRHMTMEAPQDFCAKLQKMLADCGIALVFLPHLRGSFLQGATFPDGEKIVLGMTARGRDADRFWFSLFHELAHIIKGHIGQAGGTSAEDEREADAWAADALIPDQDFRAFALKQDFSESSVLDFASREGIAPGIVVGRLQNEAQIGYNRLNNLKEHYIIAQCENERAGNPGTQ